MRPRFTLKRLLAIVAADAIVLFIWTLYPTAKAKRCVAAINEGRLDPYELVDRPTDPGAFLRYDEADTKTTSAKLVNRSWSDIVHGQRGFLATLTWHTNGSKYDRQQVVIIRATPFGYQLYRWQETNAPNRTKAE
jgi:hypothetical protein